MNELQWKKCKVAGLVSGIIAAKVFKKPISKINA